MQNQRRSDWTRTHLLPRERDELSAALTPVQRAHLCSQDYVWVPGSGVLWNQPDGVLRRARFTHGVHFETQRGAFYMDSEGTAHPLPGCAATPDPARHVGERRSP
jgi:hypothetical protein